MRLIGALNSAQSTQQVENETLRPSNLAVFCLRSRIRIQPNEGIDMPIDRDGRCKPAAILLLLGAFGFSFCGVDSRAGTARLVLDINSQYVPIGSYPQDFQDFGAFSAIDADDGVHGFEPWITDGTPAGTFLWGDLTRTGGAVGRQFYQVAGLIFTLTDDPSLGTLISVCDGTVSGSTSLTRLPIATAGVNSGGIGAVGNRFLFSMFNTTTGNRELWASDGTDAGTARVPAANGAAYSVAATLLTNGKLYFLSLLPDDTIEPWVSDGTSAGTLRLSTIPNIVPEPIGVSSLGRAGNYIVFAANTSGTGRELWRIDPSNGTVARVTDIAPGTGSGLPPNAAFGSVGSTAVFAASATGDSTMSLWRTDGTAAGTFVIAPVAPFQDLTTLFFGSGTNGTILFFAGSPATDLWATDSSIAGTVKLASGVSSDALREFGGHYYFSTIAASPAQVWTSDGTAATTKMLAQIPGSVSGSSSGIAGDANQVFVRNMTSTLTGSVYRIDRASLQLTNLLNYSFSTIATYGNGVFAFARGKLYFDNEDPQNGREIWTSDGTVAGSALLKDIAAETQTQSSNPADFVSFNGQLFFTADDGITGREVWHSDGTSQGTTLLVDANPGAAGSSPSDLSVANGALYFFAADSSGAAHLWRSDGTPAGTQALAAVSPRPDPTRSPGCDSRAIVMGGSVYFAGYDPAAGVQLWKSDGTPMGTQRVTNIVTPSLGAFGICYLAESAGQLYFQANDGVTGSELWVSDGTPSGTHEVADILPGLSGSTPTDLTSFMGSLYFLASDGTHGGQLWSSNGTAAGTMSSPIFGTGTPIGIATTGSTLLIRVQTGGALTVWSSSGNGASPALLGNDFGNMFGLTDSLFANRGFGYFAGGVSTSGIVDVEPWVTDGTVAGTHPLATINPGAGSMPHAFADFDGITVFEVTVPDSTTQLWRTNGSKTALLADIDIGQTYLAAGQNLFYTSFDPASGTELWALSNAAPVAADDAATVSSGSSVTVTVLANDTDSDGELNAGSVAIAQPPQHGSAVVNADGTVTYTPQAAFTGSDSLTYTVQDDQGSVSAPATLSITVAAAPVPPTSSGGGGGALGEVVVGMLALLVMGRGMRLTGYFRGPHFERLPMAREVMERETRLELATSTLARLRSTN
jgi:ELWxxDGT repeat protein